MRDWQQSTKNAGMDFRTTRESPMDKDTLKQELLKWQLRFYKGQRLWSAAHHGTVYLSILSSIAATILLKFDNDTYATIFTTLAAALTSLSASGGFERKWRSNRLSRCRIDLLLLDSENDSPNIGAIVEQLKEVLSKHDSEIVKYEDPGEPRLHKS
jgi:hypothetical protein